MEKYFMIKQDTSPRFGGHVGRSFVKVDNGELEFIHGDNSYFNLLKLVNEDVIIIKEAKLTYRIYEIQDRNAFEFMIANYDYCKSQRQSERRMHSFRKL